MTDYLGVRGRFANGDAFGGIKSTIGDTKKSNLAFGLTLAGAICPAIGVASAVVGVAVGVSALSHYEQEYQNAQTKEEQIEAYKKSEHALTQTILAPTMAVGGIAALAANAALVDLIDEVNQEYEEQ